MDTNAAVMYYPFDNVKLYVLFSYIKKNVPGIYTELMKRFSEKMFVVKINKDHARVKFDKCVYEIVVNKRYDNVVIQTRKYSLIPGRQPESSFMYAIPREVLMRKD